MQQISRKKKIRWLNDKLAKNPNSLTSVGEGAIENFVSQTQVKRNEIFYDVHARVHSQNMRPTVAKIYVKDSLRRKIYIPK